MEVIEGWTHREFPIDEASRVGEVRRHATLLAAELDWSDVEAGRLALVVTELATNLLRHARRGRLLLAARPGLSEVEALSIDEGPGIADLARSRQDGYSTGSGSPGTGLGAIQRLSSDFDIHSTTHGTVCVARVRRPAVPDLTAALRIGAIRLPAPGEMACGDAWAVALDGPRAAVVLADGLGHGPLAAQASQAAVAVLAEAPFADLRHGVEQMHVALQATRGAAVFCLHLHAGQAQLRYAGAGNVLGRVVSGTHDRTLATPHGTLGLQLRKADELVADWPAHALVILHSDGIATRWRPEPLRPLLERDPALVAALLWRDHGRGRDDATVVVLRRKEAA